MAVLDDGDYDDSFVAPLEQNTIHQTIPNEGGEFPRINWSVVGSQIGKELSQQLPNTSSLVPEVIQQGQVKKNQSPTVVIEVSKPNSGSGQQTMEPNNENKATCEVTTAARPERELPENLETKPQPEIRQPLVTSPLKPNELSGNQRITPPQGQEKHVVPFPNAVRRTKTRIRADTDVSVDLCTDGNIGNPSVLDPSQPKHSTSAGRESTEVNNGSLPNHKPDPAQTKREISCLTDEQCNITNNQANPRDLTVTAQLNGQDITLLVDTGAGMTVIDEQFTRDIYKGQLPKLGFPGNPSNQQPPELQTKFEKLLGKVSGKFDGSHARIGNTGSIAAFSEANNREMPELLKEIRRMENGLENLNQRVNRMNRLARRNRTVCYRCGRTGHIQYNCYYYYQPESPYQNQEGSQEYHANYNQEENQRLATHPSAHLSVLDAQYAQRVLNYHDNKVRSSGSAEQSSRQPVRTCKLTFEGEENSSDRVLTALPKQEKTNSQEKATSTTQSQQEVKLTRTNKRQPQVSHKQVSLPATKHRQSKSAAQPSNDFSSGKKDFKLKCSDLTTEGEIAGQAVQLLVDTGACVSAIHEQFFTKIYGQFPPNMSEGSLSAAQTVSGEKVPVLGKITIPLQLQAREYTCEFHVMQNLTYDAILGRGFRHKNGALIDLVDGTLSFKGTGYVGEQASTKTVPVMGTFLSQQKLNEKNIVVSDANLAPLPEICST